MIKLILAVLFDEKGGLGMTRLSIVSAIADDTGDDGPDAIVKIRRVVNKMGPQFCNLTNWPFLRDQVTWEITGTLGYSYTGADYLPATYKKVIAAKLLDGVDEYPLEEDGILERYKWHNPDDNQDRPTRFCIMRQESGYWTIEFNAKPDNSYTVYFEIELQWSDLTADTTETLITKKYYTAFVHYCDIARFLQQGDAENLAIYQDQWWPGDTRKQRHSMLGGILANLSSPSKRKQVIGQDFSGRAYRTSDYNERRSDY